MQIVSPTDRHGINALDFCNLCACAQLLRGPMHVRSKRLDFVMTDVPDVVEVSSRSPIGSSDHCFGSYRVSVEHVTPVHIVTRRVHLYHRINWKPVKEAVAGYLWGDIFSLSLAC